MNSSSSSSNNKYHAESPSQQRKLNRQGPGQPEPPQRRCANCQDAFGSFYIENKNEGQASLAGNMTEISSSVRMLDHIVRVPVNLNCKHKLCNFCIGQRQNANDPFISFLCQECQMNTTSFSVKFDYELFGRLVIEEDSIFEYFKEFLTWPYFNQDNERLVKRDLGQFIMSCSSCAKNRSSTNATDETFANLFCQDCNDTFCNKCHSEPPERQHQTVPIGVYFSNPNRCMVHKKNVSQYYCLDCRFFLCSACILQDTKWIHTSHKVQCLMNSTFETQFSKGIFAMFNNSIADSYKLLEVIEKELIFILETTLYEQENFGMLKQHVLSLFRKKSHIIQNIHICECILDFFTRYYNSRDYQMFDLNKKLLDLTRAYSTYVQSHINLDGQHLCHLQSKSNGKTPNRKPNIQRVEFSNIIQKALDNLNSFVSRSKFLSSTNVSLLTDFPLVRQPTPKSASYNYSDKGESFSQENKYTLLKPDDFQASQSAQQSTSVSTMNSDEIQTESAMMLGQYGRDALGNVYDKESNNIHDDYQDYFYTKLDTAMQVDACQYKYVKQKAKQNQYMSNMYLGDQQTNNFVGSSRQLAEDSRFNEISMSGVSSQSSSYESDLEEPLSKVIPVGTKFQVKLTTKVSPSHLSALLASDLQMYSDLLPRVSVWCADNQDLIGLSEQEILNINQGDVYGAFRNDLRLWARVRVKSVEINESSVDESKVFGLFIDIGDFMELPANRLVKLDKTFANVKQLVIPCYLYNVRPYTEPVDQEDSQMVPEISAEERRSWQWTDICMTLIQQWQQSHVNVTLTVVENKFDDYYGVDLTYNLSELIRTDASLKSSIALYDLEESSLIEAFVKCKLARYINENDEIVYKYMSRKMPKYMQMQALYEGEKCLAELSHLDSLNEFYLRKLYSDNDNGASFSELTRRMQNLYNMNCSNVYLSVFNPVPRMPVAAVFEADGTWYRGEIVEVNPGALSCQVLFVDFGNVEKIPLSQLRYLTKEIIVDDVRSFNCRLFGISFKTTENMNKAFCYMYETLADLREKRLPIQVHVKEIIATESGLTNKQDIHEIIMRYPIRDKMTNVNVILNKNGYAETKNMSIFDGEQEAPKVVNHDETKIVKKQPKPTALEKVAKEVCNSFSANKIKAKPANSVYCKVKNAISPSEIWVQDIVDAEGYFEQFHKFFCKTYEDLYPEISQTVRDHWKIGELAVMKKQKSMTFYRCRVHKFLSEAMYEVVCLDTGEYAKVAKENLFELVDSFVEKPDFKAKKCFVTGVQPTGTTNGEWSSLAKSFTSETLEDSLVYVIFTSARRADDSYETIIYVTTNQAKNVNNLILPEETKESEFVKFSDILNLKGFAMLLEKTKALDMLLDYQRSHKSTSLLTIPGSFHKYPEPFPLKPDKFEPERLYNALVTHVDSDTGEAHVQLFDLFFTREYLKRMVYDFMSAYRSGSAELKFKAEDLSRHLSHPEAQAYVCKIGNRYYRCELDRKETLEKRLLEDQSKMRVCLIDYGFSTDVETANIYRPLIVYLQVYRLSFKLKIALKPPAECKAEYPILIRSLLENRLTKVKVNSIEEKKILVGDLYSFEAKKWLSQLVSVDTAALDMNCLSSVEDSAEEGLCFKKIKLPAQLIGQLIPVAVTWIENINSIWLEVKVKECNDSELTLDAVHEQLLVACNSRKLRNLNVEEIKVNAPCCTIYKTDMRVYRAKILKVNYFEEMAVVRFVDYGNEEEIGFEKLFELNKNQIGLCEQAIQCRLKNVAINTPGTELKPDQLGLLFNDIHSELDQTLIAYNEEEQTLCAVFSQDAEDEAYQVELFFIEKNNNSVQTIAYKSLIDRGLLRYKDQSAC